MVTSLLRSRITSSITFSEMQCHSSHASKHRAIPSHETKAQSLPIHAQVGVPSKSAAAGASCISFRFGKKLLARSMQTLHLLHPNDSAKDAHRESLSALPSEQNTATFIFNTQGSYLLFLDPFEVALLGIANLICKSLFATKTASDTS